VADNRPEAFYDESPIANIPAGPCHSGKIGSDDARPRPACAPRFLPLPYPASRKLLQGIFLSSFCVSRRRRCASPTETEIWNVRCPGENPYLPGPGDATKFGGIASRAPVGRSRR